MAELTQGFDHVRRQKIGVPKLQLSQREVQDWYMGPEQRDRFGKAVEELFDVTVVDVNTLIVRGKPKRMGRMMNKTRNWKKAIVTLGPDDSIDFFEGA